VQLGFSATSSALLISAFSALAGLTKMTAGLLADYVNQRVLLIAAAAFMMLSMLLFCFFPTYEAALAGACLAGISLGCALPTAAALIAASFGSASFGSAMGWTYALIGFFAIFQVRVIGSVYDKMGSYRLAFAAFFLLATCVLAMTACISPRKAVAAPADR
jgi:MFS family permease